MTQREDSTALYLLGTACTSISSSAGGQPPLLTHRTDDDVVDDIVEGERDEDDHQGEELVNLEKDINIDIDIEYDDKSDEDSKIHDGESISPDLSMLSSDEDMFNDLDAHLQKAILVAEPKARQINWEVAQVRCSVH